MVQVIQGIQNLEIREGQDVNKPDTGTQTPQLPEVPQLSDNDKKPVNSENTQICFI